MSPLSLPVELLLKITGIACSESQSSYRSLLLASRHFYNVTQLECLPITPVTLASRGAISSFSLLLRHYPDIGPRVRNLWITDSTSEESDEIISACINVVNLGCTDRQMMVLCSLPEFRHLRCRELTLTGYHWYLWHELALCTHSKELFQQITHLRLPKYLIRVIGPTDVFTSLTHLACSPPPVDDPSILHEHLMTIQALPTLQRLVMTVEYCRPSLETWSSWETLEANSEERISVHLCSNNWDERSIWSERTRGGDCLWSSQPIGTTKPAVAAAVTK